MSGRRLALTLSILERERGGSKREVDEKGGKSYEEAGLKCQDARFTRKRNVRRFSKEGRAGREKMRRREGSRFA